MLMNEAHLSPINAFQEFLPKIAETAFIHPSATIIGQVTIGEQSSIWPQTVVRGDVNHITIGIGTNIQDLSMLHVSHAHAANPQGAPLRIGNYVTIGHQVLLHGCTIEDYCLIGMGSLIMDHAIVQTKVLVGAGSLVPEGKVLESGYLYLGRPVKKIRPLTEEELKHFEYSATHYIKLKQRYQDQMHNAADAQRSNE